MLGIKCLSTTHSLHWLLPTGKGVTNLTVQSLMCISSQVTNRYSHCLEGWFVFAMHSPRLLTGYVRQLWVLIHLAGWLSGLESVLKLKSFLSPLLPSPPLPSPPSPPLSSSVSFLSTHEYAVWSQDYNSSGKLEALFLSQKSKLSTIYLLTALCWVLVFGQPLMNKSVLCN